MLCFTHVVPGKTYGALLCALLLCALGGCGSSGVAHRDTPPPHSGNSPPQPVPEPAPDPEPDPDAEPDQHPDPHPDPESPTGAATVSWTTPTTNVDGSALTDLAGFRIYYGTEPDVLDSMIELHDAALTRHVVGGLTRGTWYFAVSAFARSQTDSGYALVGSTTVR